MTKAIIFDKDGTLFGFTQTWGPWTARLLRDLGRDADHARALGDAIGFDLGAGTFAADSPVIAGTPDTSADLMLPLLPDWTRAALIEHIVAQPVTPVPAADLRPLLTALRADGWHLAVMTNDAQDAARAQLRALDLDGFFRVIIGYDSGHGAKPDAAPLKACAAALGVPAPDCIMVGDSLHDIRAGIAANMVTVAVLTGIAHADALLCATAILPDISALPEWLASRKIAAPTG